MANPMKILTDLTASVNSLFKGNVVVSGTTTLGDAAGDVVSLVGQTTASNGLRVNGGAYIDGGLTVAGTLTTVNTVNMAVKDQTLVIADNIISMANQTAGIYVGSDSSPSASFTATGDGSGLITWNISGSKGVTVATTGSGDLTNIQAGLVNSSILNLEQTFRAIDSKIGTISNNGALSSDVSSSFTLKTQLTSTLDVLTASYNSHRYLVTGSFSVGGQAIVTLPGTKFVSSQKDFVTLDVMVRDNVATDKWTNDIVSVHLSESAGQLEVTIDAPAVDDQWKYRLIAVNENTGSISYL